ncbi:MAG: hypothetical protein LBQ40_02860 [Clostridiales bacterium]|jgi:hypothetical protein|nr:hypothetical protein [Clostridiales bacterium]
MIVYLENLAVFLCGLFISAGLAWVLKNKPRYVCAALLNALLGGIIYVAVICFSKSATLSVYSSFLTGTLGVIGFIISLF